MGICPVEGLGFYDHARLWGNHDGPAWGWVVQVDPTMKSQGSVL